jgi:hypothetical protein
MKRIEVASMNPEAPGKIALISEETVISSGSIV